MTGMLQRWRPVLAALLGIALGGFAVSQTPQMSELGRVFPITASLIAIAAGIGVLVQAMLRPAPPTKEQESVDYRRAAFLAVTLLAWALLLDPLGFVPTSVVAIVSVAVISRREAMSAKSIIAHAVAGAALVLGFSLLLREVLNVRLP